MPSPYGEEVSVTSGLHDRRHSDYMFPSPYGEEVSVTGKGVGRRYFRPAVSIPLRGRGKCNSAPEAIEDEWGVMFPSPYGEEVSVTTTNFYSWRWKM